jgi:hypothetical protein
MRKVLYQVQEFMENAWPIPIRNSNLNISIRDLLYSLVIFLVFSSLHWSLAFAAFAYEPALLCFPFNVFHGLVVHTPRYWKMRAVEPKLQLLLDNFLVLKSEALRVSSLARPFSDQFHQQRIAAGQPWNVLGFTSYGTKFKGCLCGP